MWYNDKEMPKAHGPLVTQCLARYSLSKLYEMQRGSALLWHAGNMQGTRQTCSHTTPAAAVNNGAVLRRACSEGVFLIQTLGWFATHANAQQAFSPLNTD